MKLTKKINLLFIVMSISLLNINAQAPAETVQELANVLNNLQTLLIFASQVPEKLKTFKGVVPKINQEGRCLASKTKQPGCIDFGCADNKECAGAVLSDLLKLLKPSTDALFGSLTTKDTKSVYNPGAVYAILDTVSKLPKAIPDKYKTATPAAKFTQLINIVDVVNKKLTTFASSLSAVLDFLDGVAFLLNPAKVVIEKKVELPPIEVPAAGLEDIKLEDIKIE